MSTHTVHLRISHERYETLKAIADGAEFGASVNSVASSLLNSAIDARVIHGCAAVPSDLRRGTAAPVSGELVCVPMAYGGVPLQPPSPSAPSSFSAAADAYIARVAERLRAARGRDTQAQGAAGAGVSVDQYRRAEKGQRVSPEATKKLLSWIEGREGASEEGS